MQQLAWQSTLQEPWAMTYYQQKRAAGKSHAVAVRALANIWMRIMYAMWRDHTSYATDRFRAARQQHMRKAA